MALFGLAQRLRGLGETVATIGARENYHLGFQNFTKDCARTKHEMDSKRTSSNATTVTVVVLPEMWMGRCRGAGFLHMHWILSPVGGIGHVSKDFLTYYRPRDLVFNYGIASPGTAVPVPVRNLLQVINNPRPDDDFDLKRHPKLPRAGVVFTYRKADVFHNDGFSVTVLHPPNATELTREHSMEATVRMFLTHEYFVCYDPYSYLAWIAPMLGCATIMHPLNGMSKREWLMSTMYAGYLEHSGLDDLAGIAYGWEEAKYALRTMHKVRHELFDIQRYAHDVTLPRFVRDVKRAAADRFGTPDDKFEGAMRVSDFYPDDWAEQMRRQQKSGTKFLNLRYNASMHKDK